MRTPNHCGMRTPNHCDCFGFSTCTLMRSTAFSMYVAKMMPVFVGVEALGIFFPSTLRGDLRQPPPEEPTTPEERQLVVDAATGFRCIAECRMYGLMKGGPEINV